MDQGQGSGSAAQDVDLIDSVTGSLPWAAGLMLLVTFVLPPWLLWRVGLALWSRRR